MAWYDDLFGGDSYLGSWDAGFDYDPTWTPEPTFDPSVFVPSSEYLSGPTDYDPNWASQYVPSDAPAPVPYSEIADVLMPSAPTPNVFPLSGYGESIYTPAEETPAPAAAPATQTAPLHYTEQRPVVDGGEAYVSNMPSGTGLLSSITGGLRGLDLWLQDNKLLASLGVGGLQALMAYKQQQKMAELRKQEQAKIDAAKAKQQARVDRYNQPIDYGRYRAPRAVLTPGVSNYKQSDTAANRTHFAASPSLMNNIAAEQNRAHGGSVGYADGGSIFGARYPAHPNELIKKETKPYSPDNELANWLRAQNIDDYLDSPGVHAGMVIGSVFGQPDGLASRKVMLDMMESDRDMYLERARIAGDKQRARAAEEMQMHTSAMNRRAAPVKKAQGGALSMVQRQPATRLVQGPTGGQADKVDARLSHGEYIMDSDVVSALGDGNNEAGAAKLDQMRQNIRTHKRAAPANKIPPKAKPPLAYLKKGAKR